MRAGWAIVLLASATACIDAASEQSRDSVDEAAARARMVETQLRARDIRNPAVLDAMRRVPRHEFVPPSLRHRAYEDGPLPIGEGQTISQPYIVAYMTQAIEPAKIDRVLEIGTGSGYQAAVLAELVSEVYTIEIVPSLAASAAATLKKLGYTNIHAREGDGYAGWPDAAPFDKIVVTAAPESIPQALIDQLRVGGIMAVPVGRGFQMMTIVQKTNAGTITKKTMEVRFVPMIKKD
ncbi:MAG TPA: protein-L-isoaspartate(D-aspartate) O-methyltransferase [Vicinamibacterales bacterium]|nr:protein-L-isoaspartate(D-aspartate) O-methyltransferase [Vicinamibacterales bacterium]